MRVTETGHGSAHFAIRTGLMHVSTTLAAVFSGSVAAAPGFAAWLAPTLVATFPSRARLPLLPDLEELPPTT